MLLTTLLPLALACSAAAKHSGRDVLPAATLLGADAQVNQSTGLPTILGNDAKRLLGGQLAYIVQQTTCLPGDVKARTCGSK